MKASLSLFDILSWMDGGEEENLILKVNTGETARVQPIYKSTISY